MNLINPKNKEALTSVFESHEAAFGALAAKVRAGDFRDSSFPSSLLDQMRRKGLSEGQLFWLHKLAQPESARPRPTAAESINMSGLRALFERASKHLKRPSIVLAVGAGFEVKIAHAGPGSRYPGSLMVSSPEFGGAYYGRVTGNDFFAGKDDMPAVRNLLHKMSADPVKTAAEHGHLTGKCCFCNRHLEDERSTEVGYGPVCADKFGLEWGAKVARKARASRSLVTA